MSIKKKDTAKPYKERNDKIIEKYLSGNYTISSIGRMFKITRQRAHAIVKRWREEENVNRL